MVNLVELFANQARFKFRPNFPASQTGGIMGPLTLRKNITSHAPLTTHQAQVPPGETILMQYQRITCNLDLAGEPSVEGWHRDGVTRIGILVTARDGIEGGSNQVGSARSVDPRIAFCNCTKLYATPSNVNIYIYAK